MNPGRPPGAFRIGGGWLFNPRTLAYTRDETHGMHSPYRHLACGQAFDLPRVKPGKGPRYTDADVFNCPNCGAQTDTRIGISVERL